MEIAAAYVTCRRRRPKVFYKEREGGRESWGGGGGGGGGGESCLPVRTRLEAATGGILQKRFIKNLQNSQENTCVGVSFLGYCFK